MYPENGEFIDQTNLTITFYGSGIFGTICSPVVDQPFYQVNLVLFSV